MTASKPTDPTSTNSQPEPERLGLSATQLLASGLAAMSATIAASYFGVAGTVIGAALGSVVTVIGNAVYGYSLRRTQRRVRRTLDVAVAHRFSADPARVIAHTAEAASAAGTARAGGPAASTRGPLGQPKRLALAAAGLFAAVLAVTTAFEFASGQPLSSTVTGKHGSGVSVGGGTAKKASQPPTQSSTPSSPGSPTRGSPASPTVTVTVTPSDSASPSESSAPATSSASGTPSPSGTPSGSATPAG